MKIVFSRKGFDSGTGGCPSPIIDGCLRSLPIPTRQPTDTRFGDLPTPYPTLIQDLVGKRHGPQSPCHVDPDIDIRLWGNPPSAVWRGTLGQVGAAQSHLDNQGVGVGDVFLFWGLFRPVEKAALGWQWKGDRANLCFGWLQVGDVLRLGTDPGVLLDEYPWLADHPHMRTGWPANNTLYVAGKRLQLGGRDTGCLGWGVFGQGYRLTDSESTLPSKWKVPSWLHPESGGVAMSYHAPASNCWGEDRSLEVQKRGQEFVADIGSRQDAREWLEELIREHGSMNTSA